LLREKEIQRGNKNRATLAVARKMVAYMLAVERKQQDFVPAENLVAKAVDRVGGGITPAVLPHHRTDRSVSGGSCLLGRT
jgi:hypothetical protein